MWRLATLPFLIHSAGMLVDEVWYHRRRGLPVWERWGHPLDTLTVLVCYGMALALPPTQGSLALFASAALFSCLFVTKDEWIHARHCTGGEMWLHAALFMMHPVLLGIAGAHLYLASSSAQSAGPDTGSDFFASFLAAQTAVTALFLGYQLLYWNGPWKPALPKPQP